MLVATDLMRPAATRLPLPHHGRAGRVRDHRPPVPRPRAGRRRYASSSGRLVGIAMRLTVVGCSGSYPGPESPASCYLVEADDADGRTWRILLDLGSGALGALQRYADPLGIDAVFLSHLHADHCLDLCGYYVLRRYHPDRRRSRGSRSGGRSAPPSGWPAPTACPRPGHEREFDFREHGRARRAGPVRRRAGAGRPPHAGLRPAGLRRRPPSPTPATPGRARARPGRRAASTCCWPRRPSSPATTTRRTCT